MECGSACVVGEGQQRGCFTLVFVGCQIILICLVFVRWGARGRRLPLRTDPVVCRCGVVVTRPLLCLSSGARGGEGEGAEPHTDCTPAHGQCSTTGDGVPCSYGAARVQCHVSRMPRARGWKSRCWWGWGPAGAPKGQEGARRSTRGGGGGSPATLCLRRGLEPVFRNEAGGGGGGVPKAEGQGKGKVEGRGLCIGRSGVGLPGAQSRGFCPGPFSIARQSAPARAPAHPPPAHKAPSPPALCCAFPLPPPHDPSHGPSPHIPFTRTYTHAL